MTFSRYSSVGSGSSGFCEARVGEDRAHVLADRRGGRRRGRSAGRPRRPRSPRPPLGRRTRGSTRSRPRRARTRPAPRWSARGGRRSAARRRSRRRGGCSRGGSTSRLSSRSLGGVPSAGGPVVGRRVVVAVAGLDQQPRAQVGPVVAQLLEAAAAPRRATSVRIRVGKYCSVKLAGASNIVRASWRMSVTSPSRVV